MPSPNCSTATARDSAIGRTRYDRFSGLRTPARKGHFKLWMASFNLRIGTGLDFFGTVSACHPAVGMPHQLFLDVLAISSFAKCVLESVSKRVKANVVVVDSKRLLANICPERRKIA
jgi:hypothetical protein